MATLRFGKKIGNAKIRFPGHDKIKSKLFLQKYLMLIFLFTINCNISKLEIKAFV